MRAAPSQRVPGSRDAGTSASFGALFDWDGVIVDSQSLHQAAWDEVAREFGFAHGPAEFRRHFGTQNWRAIREILRWSDDPTEIERISVRKEALYRQRLPQAADLLVHGVRRFVARLRERGVPCAIVSSSPRVNIDVVIDPAALRSSFAGIVSAEDVRQGKPEPDAFLLGAAQLGLPPDRCVVFEDAPPGVEAGRRAGMRVVALTTTHPAQELAHAHHIVPGWSDELIEAVCAWFEG